MQTKLLQPKVLDQSIRKAVARLNDLLKKADDGGIPVTISPMNSLPATDDTIPATKSVRVIIYPGG